MRQLNGVATNDSGERFHVSVARPRPSQNPCSILAAPDLGSAGFKQEYFVVKASKLPQQFSTLHDVSASGFV